MNFYQKRYIYYPPICYDTGDKMIEFEKDIGTNAGKVWVYLSNKCSATKTELKKETKLDDWMLHASLGWLAREGKVRREGERYTLGKTNLVETIGTNAGRVWSALKSSGALNKRQLTSKTNLKEQELSASIGWLAREGKIDWDEKTKTYKFK